MDKNTLNKSSRFTSMILAAKPQVVLVACALVTMAALLALPGLRFDSGIGVDISGTAEGQSILDVGKDRGAGADLLLCMPVGDALSQEGIRKLLALMAALERGSDWWTAQSASTVKLPVLDGDILLTRSLLEQDSSGRYFLENSQLFKAIFLSNDNASWMAQLSMKADADPARWYPAMRDIKSEFPELLVGGRLWVEQELTRQLSGSFIPALIAALAGIVLSYRLMTGSWGAAVLLLMMSVVPTLWLCATFAITGVPLRIHTFLAPFFTLALSTSYATHLFYGWYQGTRDLGGSIASRSRIIGLDALTTIMGFVCVMVSSFREMRPLGTFAIVGIGFALACTFFLLPALIRLFGHRFASWVPSVYRKPVFTMPRRWRRVLLVLGALVALAGLFRITVGIDWRSFFLPWGAEAKEISDFERLAGGLDTILIQVPAPEGSDFGSLEAYTRMKRFKAGLLRVPGVRSVLAYDAMVDEAIVSFGGTSRDTTAQSDGDVAETLDILSSLEGTGHVGDFVTPDWQRAWLLAGIEAPGKRPTLPVMLAAMEVCGLEAGLDPAFGGDLLIEDHLTRNFVSDQFLTLGLLYTGFFFVLCLVFRSVRRSLVAIVPSLVGMLAVLCLSAWAGWPINGINAVALSLVSSVSIDSTMMFMLMPPNRSTRQALRDATILLSVAMLALLFCQVYTVLCTALSCIAGLVVSLLMVFKLVPIMEGSRHVHTRIIQESRNS